MFRFGRRLGLQGKIAVLGGGSVLLTASALLALALWQSGEYGDLAESEADELVGVDLDHLTTGVYNLVLTHDGQIRQRLADRLSVAEHLLGTTGIVKVGPDARAVQLRFGGKKGPVVRLPAIRAGNRVLTGAQSAERSFPVGDTIAEMTGGVVSVFQFLPDRKSMVCVETTVDRWKSLRDVGSVVRSTAGDGNPDPLVAAVVRGEDYYGIRKQAGTDYFWLARPLKDASGQVVGALAVGTDKDEAQLPVKRVLRKTRLGVTGYVYVLQGKGPNRGVYISSLSGRRDGENIWNVSDWNGRYVAREVIDKALSHSAGVISMHRYKWMNAGEMQPNYKIARITYFPNWDWVIGAGITEKELEAYDAMRRQGRAKMMASMAATGGLITLLIVVGSALLAWRAVRPVVNLKNAVEKVTAGDYAQVVEKQSEDEIGDLVVAFNYMTSMLRNSIDVLERSEARYRSVVENAIEGVFTTTPEGRILTANNAFARIFGFGSAQEVVDTVTDARNQLYLNPEDRDAFRDKILAEGFVEGWETQVLRRSGETRWVSLSARGVKDESGETRFLEGFVFDITKRKMAERRLSEERLMFIGGPIVAFRWRATDSRPVEYVSPNVKDQFGYEPEEFTSGKVPFSSIVHPDDLERASGEIRDCVGAGLPWIEQEYRIKDAAHAIRWVYVFTSVVRDESGTVTHLQGHIADISERKRDEEELRSNEARLRLLNEIDRSILGVESPREIVRSAIGRIRHLFQCDFATVTFMSPEGHEVIAVDSDDDLSALVEGVWPTCERHRQLLYAGNVECCADLEAIAERCPSEEKYFQMGMRSRLIAPMTSTDGYVGSLIVAGRRPSMFGPSAIHMAKELANQLSIAVVQARLYAQVRRHAEDLEVRVAQRTEQLAAANRELESFSYSVSHDLRAPLRSIDGFSRIIVEDFGDLLPDEAQELLKRVTEAAQRMGKLINDLLELSRLTRTEIRLAEVDLSAVAQEIATGLQRAEPKRKVTFRIQPGLRVQGDPTLLQAMIGNLLENAWKYTSKHKKATIELGMDAGDGVPAYFVRDDGAGFDMAYADKLFGPFQRLHSPAEFPGSGIGLAGVQKIVLRHGGKIWAHAEPEKGATFYFTLQPGG